MVRSKADASGISVVVGQGQRSLQILQGEGGEALFCVPTWRGKGVMGLNCENQALRYRNSGVPEQMTWGDTSGMELA